MSSTVCSLPRSQRAKLWCGRAKHWKAAKNRGARLRFNHCWSDKTAGSL